MLHIADLRASVAGTTILDGLDLDVPTGEVHAIMVPSGAGKSDDHDVAADVWSATTAAQAQPSSPFGEPGSCPPGRP